MKANSDTDTCWYHYCNLEVFQSIINNKELWLSEARTTNDSTELIWFADNIKPFLVDYYEKQPNEFKKKYGDKFNTIMDNVYDEFFFENSYYHMFILCLSKNGDLLSQWRGYTPDGGNGISIGFNKQKLLELLQIQNASPPIIEIGEIDYDDKSKSKEFIEHIAESKLFDELDEIEIMDETNFVTRSFAVIERHFKIMFCNAALVKSDFFAEESEVRLFSWATLNSNGCNVPQNFTLSPIQYRSRGNMIIPYIKMNFSKYCDIANLIDEVVIGPKCQVPPSFISAILKSNGFVNAKVRKSDGFGIYR